MDHNQSLPESRDRAVSSEPCSTRPNPFDDSDIASRKRRRTSLNSGSRSRSVDTVGSNQGQPVNGEAGAQDDSAMKVDSDPITPQTPEQERTQAESQPPSGPVSSRVTLNLRSTPRQLDVIPSSPASSPSPAPAIHDTSADDVKASVETSEMEVPRAAAAGPGTPPSSASGTGSPPIEIITVQPDEDTDFDLDHPEVTILPNVPSKMVADPTAEFPFRESMETFHDVVIRLSQYLPTHESVSREVGDWIDTYIVFAKNTSHDIVLGSYIEYRDLWHNLPQFVWYMVNRKVPYPRARPLRQAVFTFFKTFARLCAHLIEFDLKTLADAAYREADQPPELISPQFLTALAVLTRRDDPPVQNGHLHTGEVDWASNNDLTDVLSAFQEYHVNAGGSVAYLYKLARSLIDLSTRFPKLIDSFSSISSLVSNIVRESCRKINDSAGLETEELESARACVGRGYAIFKAMSSNVAIIIEKRLNYMSTECAGSHIPCLAELYQFCLSIPRVVPPEVIKEQLQDHPQISADYVPELLASHWRLSTYTKLIMSSQMQLRVLSVTNMCNDLVSLWRRFNDPADEAKMAFINYISTFLVQTGLVAYILGPTCHPEITLESSNIVGFLLVSSTYTNQHTDLLWQTVTSTQDPRVSDALMRMTGRIANLYSYEGLLYLCQKLDTVPAESFGPAMRDFCEQIFRYLPSKLQYDRGYLDAAPYNVCLRLIRQSSVSRAQGQVAYPEVQTFAIQKFKEILGNGNGPDPEGRAAIYRICLEDIANKSSTSLGSLWVISLMMRPYVVRELSILTAEHGLTRLLVDELEAAIAAARAAGFPQVLSGTHNAPRKELITNVLLHQPTTITEDLGPRLWNLLVGNGASCTEDQDASWNMLNNSLRRTHQENPFLSTCYTDYLPTLPSTCFSQGALDFVRERIIPLVNDPSSIVLDDEDGLKRAGIEQLWRMVLTAPEGTIEQQAIHTLVHDVYVDSKSIVSFPHYRARKVHLALVNRCLQQLSSAAAKLRSFNDGTSSGDDEPMVIVATESQIQEQELLFVRSLSVLREFHRLHQSRGHFSAPDLRFLIPESSKGMEGDSAELKYQSFDGDKQTEVLPLNIGKRNTAASLLASLRDATGFSNYRIYYGGKPFVPQEDDVCKSLEDLQIHNGILLVKRESDAATTSARVRPGASPVEVEILARFEEMWDCLTMEERLAQEIYSFLIKLPPDEKIISAFESEQSSYEDVFPARQPFRSLYAVHALGQHLDAGRRRDSVAGTGNAPTRSAQAISLSRVLALVVAGISDAEVIERCPSWELQIELSSALAACFVRLLKDPRLPTDAPKHLGSSLLSRLVDMLSATVSSIDSPVKFSESAARLISLCLEGILESCTKSEEFWTAFCSHEGLPQLIETLLLAATEPSIRQSTEDLINARIKLSKLEANGPASPDFREFFWPIVSELVPRAVTLPQNCEQVLNIAHNLFKALRLSGSPILDVQMVLEEWGNLLLHYQTYEDVTQPETIDVVAFGLIRLLHTVLCWEEYPVPRASLPPRGYAKQLFWKHLFPPPQNDGIEESKPILLPNSRALLVEMLFSLIDQDAEQLEWLLHDLYQLVPHHILDEDNDEPYGYELPTQFERSKAIRATCGYVGLKNLSNTCYLNSLFTQLFMNTKFRSFMLGAAVDDEDDSQALLFQTQNVFGFLQDSIRRFYCPETCVSTIRTYEDCQIDIHNQMDVDEFYNLLFDRWEAQLLTAEAKRVLRSFYGGQLVQQVASKECEHISERLEPFSAIQCDIKGKTTLQESLQAYVDGEIMAGDNKYKCSTCDRHVDAVKRACLKDIPDSLIFHLKRFDFNLRTMQRSKINDYFTFPTRIDMRPYTIEHLSNTSEATSEDIFELVGVLVHSGTAESGHYYSYIRERPTASGSSDAWVEFNDDVVTSWDPSQMESACFGGPDFRPPFDANSIAYDKTYSAYMLFYQRASALHAEQVSLEQSGQPSPLRVTMSRDLAEHIRRENATILRRHCLYDPAQIHFVHLALYHMNKLHGGTCSVEHNMENVAMEMTLGHLDQVASRTKDIPEFEPLVKRLLNMCHGCAQCSLALVNYFNQRPEAFRQLVQRNPEATVRLETANLYIRALEIVKEQLPGEYGIPTEDSWPLPGPDDDSIVLWGVIRLMRNLWENFHLNLRSWPEVFGFMLSFVKLGRDETALFLEQPFLKNLMYIVWADTNLELPAQFARMITTVGRRMATRPPSYESILALLGHIFAFMDIPYAERGEPILADGFLRRFDDNEDLSKPFLFVRGEHKILTGDWSRGHANIFVEKLITISQNQPATYSIIGDIMRFGRVFEEKILRTLKGGINGQITTHHSAPYLRAAVVFCRMASNAELVDRLFAHVTAHCQNLQNTEGQAFFEFQRDVFDARQERSGQSEETVLRAGLVRIPEWVPGLLCYFDHNVSQEVEEFLEEKLFKYGPSPDFGDAPEGVERAELMVQVARELGIKCLEYLHEHFIMRRMEANSRTVVFVERVIKQCSKYYNLEEGSDDQQGADFVRLTNAVRGPLEGLTVSVEELEEDGSEWENSVSAPSEHDSVGDISMAAGDVPDAELQ